MNNDFLPADYIEPDASNGYLKLQQGENRLRILSATPLVGWEWWEHEDGSVQAGYDDSQEGDKPVRVPIEGPVPMKADRTAKRFWAVTVWNYQLKQVQIWHITQKTIRDQLLSLSRKKSWGNPVEYDIIVDRSGDKLETEYTVSPEPKETLDLSIAEQAAKTPIDLTKLFEGGDPFAANADPGDFDSLADSLDTADESET